MPPHTDDLRIRALQPLISPADLIEALPCDTAMSETVAGARAACHAILHGDDDRGTAMRSSW